MENHNNNKNKFEQWRYKKEKTFSDDISGFCFWLNIIWGKYGCKGKEKQWKIHIKQIFNYKIAQIIPQIPWKPGKENKNCTILNNFPIFLKGCETKPKLYNTDTPVSALSWTLIMYWCTVFVSAKVINVPI